MERPSFDIVPCPEQRLLRITMAGWWQVCTVAKYREAVSRAAATMVAGGCSRDAMRVLVDARNLVAQSQEEVAAYQQAFAGGDTDVARIATLAKNSIFQLQVKRIGVRNQRIFSDEREARAWLLNDRPD